MKKEIVRGSPEGPEPGPEKINDVIGGAPAGNPFYGAVSLVYRVSEFLLLGVLLLFIVISAVKNAGGVTYSNLEYIVRNFAVRLDENSDKATEILYNPDSDMNYSLYGSGIAVCGNSGVTVFSATGRKTLSYTFNLRSPVMAASSKYILVYENGGCEYRVFNAFSQVYEAGTDYPVRGASVADDGTYVLITGTDQYTSCAEVYDSDFRLRSRYLKNGYIVCAALDRDSRRIMLATLSMDSEGRYLTEIMVCVLGSDAPEAVYTVRDDFPLACVFRDGGVALICTGAFHSFPDGSSQPLSYSYGGRTLSAFACSESSLCLLLENDLPSDVSVGSANRTRTARLLGYDGSELGSYTTDTAVAAVHMYGSEAYVLQYGLLTVITPTGLIPQNLTSAIMPADVLAYSEGHVYICCRSAAYYLRVK
jgi:hypothetical protein